MALTGYAPSPHTGVRPPEEVTAVTSTVFHSSDLPMLIEFNGRKYFLSETKKGGLLLNGAVTIGGQTLRR